MSQNMYNDFSQFSKALNWSHFKLFFEHNSQTVFIAVDRRVFRQKLLSVGIPYFLSNWKNFEWQAVKLEQLKQEKGEGRCLHTDSLFNGRKKKLIWIVILFGLNSSQQFWNPLVIVPPVGCESLAKLCWLWSGSVQPTHQCSAYYSAA